MQNLRAIFRKDKKDGTIIAFLPELECNFGNVVCYEHNGQHSETHLMYYLDCTVCAKPEDYRDLLEELRSIFNGFNIIVGKSMKW